MKFGDAIKLVEVESVTAAFGGDLIAYYAQCHIEGCGHHGRLRPATERGSIRAMADAYDHVKLHDQEAS